MGDSFYEYLLKSYVMDKNDVTGKEMYQHTLESFDYFLKKTSQGNYFLSEYPAGIQKMEHLACFAPGMLALGSLYMPENTGGKTNSEWLNLAGELTKSCHMMYEKASTGVGPNEAYFDGRQDGYALDRYSLLRPETIESCFYMWRTTKNPIYKKWAWDYAKSIEKNAKSNSGYSGLRNVNFNGDNAGNLDGNQQTFLLAETFKYMYLIFSDDDVISLDDWVFNTEAHPFKIIK